MSLIGQQVHCDYQRFFLALDLAALFNALGGPAPSRYLLVFQNPAELRPTGGFPGTMALVTLNQGELGGILED